MGGLKTLYLPVTFALNFTTYPYTPFRTQRGHFPFVPYSRVTRGRSGESELGDLRVRIPVPLRTWDEVRVGDRLREQEVLLTRGPESRS